MGIQEAQIKPREGSQYSDGEWIWNNKFYYDIGQSLRFRIHHIKDDHIIGNINEDGLGVLNWWKH